MRAPSVQRARSRQSVWHGNEAVNEKRQCAVSRPCGPRCRPEGRRSLAARILSRGGTCREGRHPGTGRYAVLRRSRPAYKRKNPGAGWPRGSGWVQRIRRRCPILLNRALREARDSGSAASCRVPIVIAGPERVAGLTTRVPRATDRHGAGRRAAVKAVREQNIEGIGPGSVADGSVGVIAAIVFSADPDISLDTVRGNVVRLAVRVSGLGRLVHAGGRQVVSVAGPDQPCRSRRASGRRPCRARTARSS